MMASNTRSHFFFSLAILLLFIATTNASGHLVLRCYSAAGSASGVACRPVLECPEERVYSIGASLKYVLYTDSWRWDEPSNSICARNDPSICQWFIHFKNSSEPDEVYPSRLRTIATSTPMDSDPISSGVYSQNGELVIQTKPNILSPRDMTVLVLGRTGSGKSTLINSFLHNGCKKAEEKRGVDSQRHEDIETHKQRIHGVGEIKMIDTNGLCDKEAKSDEIVKKLNAQNIFPDLVLICINITERIDQNLIEETTNLQKFYGDSFWQHAIFIITFCNRFEYELRDEDEEISTEERNYQGSHC